ncbi:hypothetical protein GCK32_007410 [Trichostrongylus colubriformis]|uniref:RNase H type-1 domain-containing protein n=1 Tax=Trichostrongylus colubriformis TaxID=6319 RepID=A0AAN8EX96_TRICO
MKDTGETNVRERNSEFYPGLIHDHISMWMALEPSILVLDTIINGYTIPFDEAPEPPHRVGNRKSALRNAEFVDITIADLITDGAVKEVVNPQVTNLFVHPLSVAEGKKLRLVLELSSLNKTDNQAACRIYRVGSNLEYLQQQAEDIWELQESLKLNRVTVEWIPREQNVLADLENRELDYDSWGINSRTAQAVQNNLLFCELDMFAYNFNTVCERFFSRDWCPFTSGIDAFRSPTSWSGHPYG